MRTQTMWSPCSCAVFLLYHEFSLKYYAHAHADKSRLAHPHTILPTHILIMRLDLSTSQFNSGRVDSASTSYWSSSLSLLWWSPSSAFTRCQLSKLTSFSCIDRANSLKCVSQLKYHHLCHCTYLTIVIRKMRSSAVMDLFSRRSRTNSC